MLFKKKIVALFFSVSALNLSAQDSFTDTLDIAEVIISANRLNSFATGLSVTKTSVKTISDYSTQTLGDLLSQQSQIFIKSYGNSGVASASTRGSGTNHTAVLWNGFNLQDAMNGGVNLNNIPVNFIDEMYIQQGGSGALFGSGALGGVIHFNTKLEFDKGFESNVCQKYGSFDNLFNSLNFSYSNSKIASSTRIFQQSAKNNYSFLNTTLMNSPVEQVSNASFSKWGIQQSLAYKLNKKQQISGNIWYQDAFTEIPDLMIIIGSTDQSQQDNSLRATLEWNRSGEAASTSIRSAYFDNRNVYTNGSIDEITHNILKTSITEIEQKVQLGSNHLVNLGINNTNETGNSEYYSSERNRNRISLFGSYKIYNKAKTIAATASIRNEYIDNQTSPLTYSLGGKADILSWMQFNTSFSKNYRLPTFNELYWGNWGNPDLEPEWGYSTEIGLRFHKQSSKHNFESNLTYYNSNISNWIIWVPEHTIWTPKNVKEVWLRGFENTINYSFAVQDFSFNLKLNYTYSKATNEGDQNTSQTIHKQIIYVPLHQANYGIEIKYKFVSLQYNEYGVSKRYISENNGDFVESYNVANMHISFAFDFHKLENILSFSIYNIKDTNYQVMAWYPMPLRHYALSYKININPIK
jgi:vitamin B12 transporter